MSEMIPQAVKALHFTAELDRSDLQSKIKKAGNRWTGAIPTEEALNQTFPPPKAPQSLHVIGADGSQIYPDRHASAFYYLINIGSIVVAHGSGKAPTIQQESRLFFELEDLYDEADHPIQSAYINLRRDVAEMKTLAERAESLAGQQTLAILDNSLLLWMALQTGGSTSRETERYLQQYLKLLDRLRSSKSGLAGFIDRPRSVSVLALIHLAGLPDDQITQETVRLTPFRGLTDRAIFTKLLPPGHRSARFISASPLNRDFRTAGHEVHFFYLNTDADGTIVRVEIPIWVAQNPELLNRVHAGILKDCQTTGGFPYTLVRAHELAVIPPQERAAFEDMLQRTLLGHGLRPTQSQKALTKQLTGQRKQHRL
ncbi:MAG: DNA double-strand break repair nuclease NurA [Anaerolineales bacterium]